ncbi:MAG: sensor histidine kinase KdpD [Herpetosiphonaceae bacterium]|nr:sensor histidine kinase KdpD [Herpetosiphonaceae bacterium]
MPWNETTRKTPEELLAQVQHEARGKFKLFLGAAAGVGKTYRMLDEARIRKREGLDVVIGWIETHGRAETESSLAQSVEQMPMIPPRALPYKGTILQEMDLNAIIARQPQLVVVDELAHTNAAGSRNTKRYQDVFELLDAGINVYSAMNVQHLESLNNVVQQITGVQVRETVPDRVLERADEIELIDVSPAELIERLKAGKIYKPDRANAALQNFFRSGNLTALRELALRRAAGHVEQQLDAHRATEHITASWPAAERVMVCVTADPFSQKLIRSAARLALSMHGELWAVYVEQPGEATRRSTAAAHQLETNLSLARTLGAEVVALQERALAPALLVWAREHNVAHIVVGKGVRPRWQRIFRASVADDIVDGSGDIDVMVVTHKRHGTSLMDRVGESSAE